MSKCKSCGAPIVWGVTGNDKNVPLDPPEKRYVFVPGRGLLVELVETWLSHFATCPNADQHRKGS